MKAISSDNALCVIYSRCIDADQPRFRAKQLASCRAVARKHSLSVFAEVHDNGHTLDRKRPGFEALMFSIRRGCAHIIVYDPSRLFRDLRKALMFRSYCRRHGTCIWFATCPTVVTPAEEKFCRLLLKQLAEMERKIRHDRRSGVQLSSRPDSCDTTSNLGACPEKQHLSSADRKLRVVHPNSVRQGAETSGVPLNGH